jgi:hypothetical protein
MTKRSLISVISLCTILLALARGTGLAAPAAQTPTPTPTTGPTKPILLTDSVPDPHQDGVLYFAETGHTLRGMFLKYWQTYGGMAQFGYPITEEFFEPSGPGNTPLQVQYFERSRFEMHRDNSVVPNEVLMGLLGSEFHPQDPPATPLPTPAQYFPQTGHNLSGAFLDYWQTHGGLFVHGYPISDPAMETSTDGKQYLTQWFERSRFELHPQNAGTPYEVLLGQLGRQLAEKKGYPYGWYPAYGHAADYSWLAGYVSLYEPGGCMFPSCGCSLFRYGDADSRAQLNQPDGYQYFFSEKLQSKVPQVVFGRLAHSGELTHRCNVDGAPIYYVAALQDNPAQ